MANTREPLLKPVPILSLRPTQMTVGMREVKEKRKRWRERKSDRKRAEMLGKHMIPVVVGPDEHHYVVDHHHLARALHDEGVKDVLVTVIADLTMVDREAFWGVMDNKRSILTMPRASGGISAICRGASKASRTIRSAAWPASCAGPAALPRTPSRSANFCGPISCGGGCRAGASRTISPRRSRRALHW